MEKNKFIEKLEKIQKKNNSLVCVGLDTDLEKLPSYIMGRQNPVFEFNKSIIDTTHALVCAYKPNIAFYEAQGISGIKALKKTIDYIKKKYHEIPIILDAKRGDIANTNNAYIKSIFKDLGVDAVTLHPYLGKEALMPFLKLKDRFFFILCKTSNPGADEFQDLKVNGVKLYQYIAKQVSKKWNGNKNCGLVVGATYPKELCEVRKIVKNMLLLIPGIGKQGGDIEKTVNSAKDSRGFGMMINSSRGIIFASGGRDFAQAAGKSAEKLRKEINKYR